MVSQIVFDTKGLQELVHTSAKELPALLIKDLDTAHLSTTLDKYGDLQKMLDLRFTVAVIGQMKVGKSTLMNALIGKDLALTGVTETTATINWFRHKHGDLCHKFRVHWKDGSTDDKPLADAKKWMSTARNIAQTTSLDFFADVEFLETADIVDTPGTRSVLEDHQKTTEGFLAEELHNESLFYGGKADAVIYAINPVARQADIDMLQFFGDQTRLPGASPANSVAVVQKWEHYKNPLTVVQEQCERLQQDLDGKVSVVLPTSGLLANATRNLCEDTWQKLAKLGGQSTDAAISRILLYSKRFGEEVDGASLTGTERKHLMASVRKRLGEETNWWTVLHFSVRLAHEEKIDDGTVLRKAVLDASGIEELRNVLQDRFFSRSDLIQPLTLLQKLVEPCRIAQITLRNKLVGIEEDMEGDTWKFLYEPPYNTDRRLDAVRRYIDDTTPDLNARKERIQQLADKIGRIGETVERNWSGFDTDLRCLDALESLESSTGVSQEDVEMLQRLFGKHGTAVWQRLGLESPSTSEEEAINLVEQKHDHCLAQSLNSTFTSLYEQSVQRLEQILTALEVEKRRRN